MKRILEKMMNVVENIAASLIAISVLIIALQVIFRYVLGHPLTWTEQLARYVFIWVCMLGVPLAVYKGATFKFDLVVKALPVKVQDAIAVLVDVINMLFSAYWLYWTVRLIEKAGWRSTIGVEIPMGYLYAAQVVCALFLFIAIGAGLVAHTKKLIQKGEE